MSQGPSKACTQKSDQSVTQCSHCDTILACNRYTLS